MKNKEKILIFTKPEKISNMIDEVATAISNRNKEIVQVKHSIVGGIIITKNYIFCFVSAISGRGNRSKFIIVDDEVITRDFFNTNIQPCKIVFNNSEKISENGVITYKRFIELIK